MRVFSQVTAAALILCSAGSAMAESTAHVSAGHLSYTLVDLTPDDGIAPSITFVDSTAVFNWAATPQVRVFPLDYASTMPSNGYELHYPMAFDDALLERHHGNSYARAALTGRHDLANTELTLDGRVDATGKTASTDAAVFSGPAAFELSANTAVIFSADSHIAVRLNENSRMEQSLSAHAELGIHKPWDFTSDPQATYSYVSYTGTESQDYDLAETLTIELRNDTQEAVLRAVDLQAHIWLQTRFPEVPQVPEPATWLSLAAGLGIVGLWRRRQQH